MFSQTNIAVQQGLSGQEILIPSVGAMRSRFPRLPVSQRRGFTLVELMVVIVIIGLLSGVVTVSVRSYLIRSKQNIAKLELGKMTQALESFYAAHDRYPNNSEGLEILAQKSEEFPEGLIGFVPKDPWGHPYEYVSPGRTEAYEIISYGADHREGGSGADSDIRSDQLGRS